MEKRNREIFSQGVGIGMQSQMDRHLFCDFSMLFFAHPQLFFVLFSGWYKPFC